MPSTRYTVRLPPALDTAVQERVRQGTPFAVLIREALAAYLADTTPTGTPISADSTDMVRKLQEQLATLTMRVEALEQVPTHRRQSANRAPTSADRNAGTPATPHKGRRPSPLRGRILDLLQAHPDGLRAEELRVYLRAEKPIGDLLQGMQRAGLIRAQGRRPARRYVVVA